MVNQKGVDIGHPSKGRPGRDPDLGRLKFIGPRQMRWDDFSVNVDIVVLKCSVQQLFGVDIYQYILAYVARRFSALGLQVNMKYFSICLTSGLQLHNMLN